MLVQNESMSRIEKMLGFQFESDPRHSRFPLPKRPRGHRQDGPYTVPFDLTPEIAKDWLKYRVIREDRTPKELIHEDFTANRRFLVSTLTGTTTRKGWISTLKDGEWNPGIHQGMAFTSDGFLSDGQHRAAAVALSGVTITIPVTGDAAWSAFHVTDAQRSRTAGQMLGNMPYAENCAAAARFIIPVLRGTESNEFVAKNATKQEVVDLVQGWDVFHGDLPRAIMTAAASHKNRGRIPVSPLFAVTVMARVAGADVFKVNEFLAGIGRSFSPRDYVTLGKSGEDPRWILRQAFTEANVKKNKDVDGHVSANIQRGNAGLIRRCMSVWLEEEEVSTLERTRSNRALPQVWNADRVRQYHADHVS